MNSQHVWCQFAHIVGNLFFFLFHRSSSSLKYHLSSICVCERFNVRSDQKGLWTEQCCGQRTQQSSQSYNFQSVLRDTDKMSRTNE